MHVKLNDNNTNNIQNIVDIAQATLAELRRPKMHWPARAEAVRALVAVLVLLAIGAALVGGVDFLLSHTMDVVMSHR